jgi:transposase
LSWQETAVSFRSTWDKVCQSVEYVVQWGIEHRQLGPIAAIGVDEIQYAKGHKYLTLVYQIEQHCTRLLWIGRERTVASFEQFLVTSAKVWATPDISLAPTRCGGFSTWMCHRHRRFPG